MVQVTLPPDLLVSLRMIGLEEDQLAAEMRRSVALDLFARGLLSTGKAAQLAGLPLDDFVSLLSRKGIPVVQYTLSDLVRDREALGREGH